MPVDALTLKYQSFYGELSFETAPRNIGPQEGVAVSNRVRILQNRDIANHDMAVLSSVLPPTDDAPRYDVIRAYHGIDPESGELITDLTLERLVQDDGTD
jgi:hypothetical protein